ncbi:MAG: hypothetical protein J6Q84_04315 [Kiritimatiellae bacterium]|nr:hypothetical protein [Kiritimatiellia bacterium]
MLFDIIFSMQEQSFNNTTNQMPPKWHGDELAAREELYTESKLSISDWEDVKARLVERLNKLKKLV